MAEESNSENKPDTSIADVPDIDALLEQAAESLDDVEAELGADDSATGEKPSPGSAKQVDEAMAAN